MEAITIQVGKFYVYHHLVDGKIVYVGSGMNGRAFTLCGRGEFWRTVASRAGRVEVRVVAYYATRAEARAAEIEAIRSMQPIGNQRGTEHGRKPKRKWLDDGGIQAKRELQKFHQVWG